MISAQSPGWQNPRVLLTLLVVFLSGAVFGMLAMSMGVHQWIHPHSQSQPSWREAGKDVSLQRLRKELDLSPAQSEQLETILDDFFTYYHTLQAQLDDVRSSGKQRILRLLNDRQKKKFEQLAAEPQSKSLR
jgi:hypothetical protein